MRPCPCPYGRDAGAIAAIVARRDPGDRPIDARGIWSEGGIDRRGATDADHLLLSDFDITARPAAVTVYDSRSALAMVERSDLVALVPLHLSRANLKRFDVRPLEKLPAMPTATISMLWHRSRSDDAGHRWRQLFIEQANILKASQAD